MNTNIVFNDGVNIDPIFAHRGDIFTVDGLFKNLDDIEKDDHIIAKESRPVLIISDDEFNSKIIKVLPLSSKGGSDDRYALSSHRNIKIPNIQNRSNQETYIDTSQIFTINTYQLRYKLATVSQEIVDAAVSIAFMQNMNKSSANTVVKFLQEQYPYAKAFRERCGSNIDNDEQDNFILDNALDPSVQIFSNTENVSLDDLNALKKEKKEEKNKLLKITTIEQAKTLHEQWKTLGTDMFRNKYGLSKQEYFCIRDICIKLMLGKVPNFKKFDWEG